MKKQKKKKHNKICVVHTFRFERSLAIKQQKQNQMVKKTTAAYLRHLKYFYKVYFRLMFWHVFSARRLFYIHVGTYLLRIWCVCVCVFTTHRTTHRSNHLFERENIAYNVLRKKDSATIFVATIDATNAKNQFADFSAQNSKYK